MQDGQSPVLLAVEERVEYFHAHGDPALDQLLTASGYVGSNPAVRLLNELEHEAKLTRDAARGVGAVWSIATFPERELGRARWLELFRIAGFTIDTRR